MSTTVARRTELWRATALAPRVGAQGAQELFAEGLVLVDINRDVEPELERALVACALQRSERPHGRLRFSLRRAALAALVELHPAAAVVLAAADAAAAPAPAPRLVGVLNVTPDSFSDGGQLDTPAALLTRARELLAGGAARLDVGGESTRPGAAPVPVREELARVVPAIETLAAAGLGPLAVDTRRAAVAAAALAAGATQVNDVEAGTVDPEMLPTVADSGAEYVLMHMRGEPRTMQRAPHYRDVVGEVAEFLRSRLAAAEAAGIAAPRLRIDPGIGFGKDLEHNLALLRALPELRSLGAPLYVGVSRKRFLGQLTGEADPARRLLGSAAAVACCVAGGAQWLRVHDVAEMRAVAAVAAAVRDGATEGAT
jgi:dihydropteroate synthase